MEDKAQETAIERTYQNYMTNISVALASATANYKHGKYSATSYNGAYLQRTHIVFTSTAMQD